MEVATNEPIYETIRFWVEVGVIGEDKDPQYLVRSKQYGVVEFCHTALYFARDWAKQMDEALDKQEMEDTIDKNKNIVSLFPGGGSTN